MNEWAFSIGAAWIKSASNLLLAYSSSLSNRCCSSIICGLLPCVCFLDFDIWLLNFLIFISKSLSSLESILICAICLFIDFSNYDSLVVWFFPTLVWFLLVPGIPSVILVVCLPASSIVSSIVSVVSFESIIFLESIVSVFHFFSVEFNHSFILIS